MKTSTLTPALKTRRRPLPSSTVQALVAAEYHFVAIDTDLSELMGKLHGLPLPGILDALADLTDIRSRLMRVLGRLDEPITRIVRAWEANNNTDAVDAFDPENDLPF